MNSIDRPIDIDIGDLSGCDWELIEWILQRCGLHQGRLSLVRLFEYGQSCGGAMSAVPDRSEIDPYPGGHWAIFRGFSADSTSPVHFRGRAISPKAPMSAETDRSEIGPYLGGHWAPSVGPALLPLMV